LTDKPPPLPTDVGWGYAAANDAIEDGHNPVEWLEGAENRIVEELDRKRKRESSSIQTDTH